MNPLYALDHALLEREPVLIGVDEAGRGCLAGPLVCAAVVLDYQVLIENLNDSKKLSPQKREKASELILSSCLAHSIIQISTSYIDRHNILVATMEGMKQAIQQLGLNKALCLVDGNCLPRLNSTDALILRAVVGGDAKHACIAAASILAKVHRDYLMTELDSRYPEYGFAIHKGYGTKAHLRAIQEHGPSKVHRMSFAPMKNMTLFNKAVD